jgi:RNA ligase
MNYKFPKIRTLDDVLPHIEGRSEFIVAERDFGFVVNYMVSMQNTFDMESIDDIGGAIRRELRGIKFGLDRKIIARPFHKFFNVGERAETQIANLDFSQDHRVLSKEDGSMAHPILHEGKVRWCTKMGFSSVAEYIQTFADKNNKYNDFANYCMCAGFTPLFEYVGPHNKVVIDYREENMILLAIRNVINGEYVSIDL